MTSSEIKGVRGPNTRTTRCKKQEGERCNSFSPTATTRKRWRGGTV
jgi:hypothetical protein